MRNILILLYLSYVCSDKLDLTYLPPPGSEYAGGRPDDIQTPLEFPKKTYSSTRRPPGTEFSQGIANPTDYEATIGINRVPPRPDYRPATPVSNVQSTFGVPTTTVSYAFTQTTTHPPTESYETTINPITGVPTFNNFNTASQEPGFNENKSTQYYPTIPGSTSAANFYEGAQKLPGRENINQNGYQSSYSTTPTSATKFPVGDFSSNLSGQNYGDRTAPSLFQNSQQTYPDRDSAISFGPNQYNLNNSSLGNFINRPGFVSSTTTQHSPTGLRESLAGIENNQKPSDSPYQNQYEQDFNQNKYSDQSEIPNQQFSGTYANDKGTSELPTKDSSKARLPFSPGFSSKQLPAKQQPGFNRYDTKPSDPKYTGPNNFGNIDSTIYRPPRPQAEADRNAVILNYENVLTPEGFAYTFDTSNGIHADESGTAVDGVKAKGSFSYTGDDGNVYSIVYTADENGFQPHGEHLPTPPPIPEAIQRIIEKVKQEKEAGIFDDGTYDEDKYGYKKYQGDKGYHPKDSAINYDNVDFENKNRYNLPSRTQIGSKKPSAVDSNTIYDKTIQPTSQSDFEHQVISSDKGRPSEYTNTDAVVTLKGRKPNINNLKDISNEPFINRIPSRRPSVEIDSQYEVDDNNRRLSGQYPDHGNEHYYKGVTNYDGDDKRKGAHDNGVKLIHDNEDIRNEDTKGLNEPIEYVGKHNQGVFDNYSGSKTSSERPSKPSYEDAYKYDEANEYHREEAPGLKTSSRYPSKSEYGDNRITSQSPSGSRTKPSKKVSSFDQTLTKTRRPNRPGLRVNDDEEFVDYIDSTKVQDNSQINDYLGTTPYYGAYEDEDKVTSDVPQIYSTKYAATQDEYPETTDEYDHYIDENSKNQYGVRLSSKPVFNPSTGIVEYIERNVNKTGYQYIPPRTKFDEINKLPERLSTTKRPSQQTYYTEESTGRPFVTPGGKFVTYKTPDGEYFERDGTIVKYPSQNQGRPNVNINTGNSPDQIFTKEIVSTPQLPITPTSPSYSSTYQTQTPGFQNKFEAALKPSEPGAKFGTRRPYDGVSSTTPPSRRPVFYDSTQTAITPGQQNLYYSETTRKLGAFSSSTIPTSTQGPAAEEYSPDGNKYSTYRTMEPVNPTNDYRAEITASRLPTAGPTKGPNTVETVKYGSRLPSTTYRPNYTIVAKGESPTARPGTVVDRYGRPIPTLVSQGFNKQYPGEETNDYVNNKPGRPQYGLNGEITPTGYQTSTQRIIGEDFSGPKQQQKFDPKTGYYY